MRLAVLLVVLAVFGGWSSMVVLDHGYFGFLALADDRAWGLQVLLDLVISLVLFSSWMKRDARERGLPFAPYLVGIVTVGSIGALAYLVHREVQARGRVGARAVA